MKRTKKLRPRPGAATVEYALFLVLMAGGMVLVADGVGYAMRSSFDDATLAMQSEFTARHLPVEDLPAPEDLDLVAALVAPDTSAHVQTYQFAGVAGSLLCGALVWYGLYCKRTNRRIDQAHDLTEQLNEWPGEINHDDLFAKRQQILRILSTDMSALLESRLEVRHLMSRHLKTVGVTTPRAELKSLMEEHKLRHLLVCDEAGKLIGLVSDRDLSRKGASAQQLMTRDPISLEAHAQVNPAITLLINKRISCLPVIQNGAPIGVLTSTDLMMALQCSMQLLQRVAGELRTPTKTVSALSAPVEGLES